MNDVRYFYVTPYVKEKEFWNFLKNIIVLLEKVIKNTLRGIF